MSNPSGKNRGAYAHPSRVPNRVKMERVREYNKEQEKNKKKLDFKPLDLSKPNWSS